jgi:hypothetical protein
MSQTSLDKSLTKRTSSSQRWRHKKAYALGLGRRPNANATNVDGRSCLMRTASKELQPTARTTIEITRNSSSHWIRTSKRGRSRSMAEAFPQPLIGVVETRRAKVQVGTGRNPRRWCIPGCTVARASSPRSEHATTDLEIVSTEQSTSC